MNNLLISFAIAGGLAAILTHIGLWAPRKLWVKISALITAALFLPIAYIGFSDLLSRPKPIGIEWAQREIAEAAVISAQMEEGEAIYLWLAIDGIAQPRSYVLPWSEKLAQQLHDAQRQASAEGTGVQMKSPFEDSLDEQERKFYATPQEPRPPKYSPENEAFVFRQSRATSD